MKQNIKCFITATIVGTFCIVYAARADESTAQPRTTDPMIHHGDDDSGIAYPVFRDQELQIDLFGSSALGKDSLNHLSGNRYEHHAFWGGGGGLTYYFLRYVGVGGEFDADARTHHFADSAEGNVFLRYPIESIRLAPYVFGGGGYQFEEIRQDFAQAGGGLEFRFCRHVGIFADGRYVFAEHTQDYALARAGLRITF